MTRLLVALVWIGLALALARAVYAQPDPTVLVWRQDGADGVVAPDLLGWRFEHAATSEWVVGDEVFPLRSPVRYPACFIAPFDVAPGWIRSQATINGSSASQWSEWAPIPVPEPPTWVALFAGVVGLMVGGLARRGTLRAQRRRRPI